MTDRVKNQLIDVLNTLIATPNGPSRWSAAEALAEQLGIKSILVAEGNGSLKHINWINTNMPSHWMEEYIDQDYLAVDPLVDRLAHHPGRQLMTCGTLTKTEAQNKSAWALDHGLKDVGYNVLHCSRYGDPGAVGTFVTLAYEDRSPDQVQQDLLQADMFSALLASTIGADTLSEWQQFTPLPRYTLTPRQRDVLSFLAQGYQTARIAEKLGVTETTVTMHFGAARKALGAMTREQALVIALQHGLISL